MNFAEFFAMGGYAAFVWPSVGLVLFALVWNVFAARRLLQRARVETWRRIGAGEQP